MGYVWGMGGGGGGEGKEKEKRACIIFIYKCNKKTNRGGGFLCRKCQQLPLRFLSA